MAVEDAGSSGWGPWDGILAEGAGVFYGCDDMICNSPEFGGSPGIKPSTLRKI